MTRLLLAAAIIAAITRGPASPQAAVDELLAADRAFSASAAKHNVIDALSAMFIDDIVMPLPTGSFARDKKTAANSLSANPDNPKSRVEWTPIRGGVSADGQHGFTVGYMTLLRPDQTRVPIKYVAYWVRKPEGWRVAVYKRTRSAEGSVSHALMPPALPGKMVAPSLDARLIARRKDSLDKAERAFSDEAQKIGLGPAFAKHGTADAVNSGGPAQPAFTVGAEAIGRSIGAGSQGAGSPVSWSPDGVLVASSGDLGVTFGMIRPNTPPPAGQPAAIPFITIWRRASPSDVWRYVAE